VIETPSYDLTVFKVHFGLVTLKAYSKGEHVLRFEAVVHNTRQLHLGRVLERFPEIVARLHAMLDRFTSVLDCVDVAFLPGEILDELPRSSRLGATRVGGIDLNKARVRAVLAAVVALAAAPRGFTVADLTEKVHSMTGETDYRVRQAAYDLRKLRAKGLVEKPERSRRYVVPPDAARTITALSVLRDQVVSPILAGVRSPRQGRKPSAWTRVDRDYESLRIGMQTLFDDLGISTTALAA
jgi:DNA-binding transcriptional ArsR family regulator